MTHSYDPSDHDILMAIFTRVERLDRTVHGNGQEGILAKVTRNETMVRELDDRMDKQEAGATPNERKGIAASFSIALIAFVSAALDYLGFRP